MPRSNCSQVLQRNRAWIEIADMCSAAAEAGIVVVIPTEPQQVVRTPTGYPHAHREISPTGRGHNSQPIGQENRAHNNPSAPPGTWLHVDHAYVLTDGPVMQLEAPPPAYTPESSAGRVRDTT
jgi:hypothetical protein